MHRVIKSGGRLFTTGPMPDNKKVFYDIIREATGKPIPPMPGSSRFGSEILNTVKSLFSDVKVELFENPLVFEICRTICGIYSRLTKRRSPSVDQSF